MKSYRAGIDVGSTTVKLIIIDENSEIIYGEYRRHHANTQKTIVELLKDAKQRLGSCELDIKITGSGAINLGKALNIHFVQEVVAVAGALKKVAPQTDVAIELGGEDAKIIYFSNGLDERMNGVCAGGTGSFIDQMAALLQTDAQGLNEAAKDYKEIYPIAARCGVFAKTDIQPLINDGATKSDLAASIFQAVVNQTISGLACGKPIRGCVAYLGGPLHYLSELKKAFNRTLNLPKDKIVDPSNSHLFAALGAAINEEDKTIYNIECLIEKLEKGVAILYEMPRLSPLFRDEIEYNQFIDRHKKAVVSKKKLKDYNGNAFLGIDAGSTTTKITLIGENGELLFSFYDNNHGNPIETAKRAMRELNEEMHDNVVIARACSTGYGEALLKAAFRLDDGEVETIAHCTAAEFFCDGVDCVVDIGGQDMKCIKLKEGVVDTIMLNEACSSGCGSFIENFATSLGYSVHDFSQKGLYAQNPVDLGTRCTVFMNSNVKQAQKEGASVEDISAGLAYSVIKNAIYKVIKLTSAEELGNRIVVQGGTFYNKAVLRAFEKIVGVDAICPDISGLMGAFGAALIAKNNYSGQESTILDMDSILSLKYDSTSSRCKGCSNNCMLTVNKFQGGRNYISGNRCEKGLGNSVTIKKGENLIAYKRNRIFSYEPLSESEATRGTIGIPRVLNIYENYPFWATLFKELGFRVIISPYSDRKIYELGMESIPSESECYPAKLAHGHVQWLINNGIKTIFYPSVFYELKETEDAQNNYNCPIVSAYPENIKNNVEAITDGKVRLIHPFISFSSEEVLKNRLIQIIKEEWEISEKEIKRAVSLGWAEHLKVKEDIKNHGREMLDKMTKEHCKGIVLAGRPYHIDPEINHGIPDLITTYGLYVFSEDSLPIDFTPQRPIRVVDQWVYHSRLYSAAEFVGNRDDLELVQLTSFGCGLDAVTSDQVSELLEKKNKLYTLLKIDEVNNLGAVKIRIRSLMSAMKIRSNKKIGKLHGSLKYNRILFSKEMYKEKYTIIAPQMSPIHFDILEPIFKYYNFNIEILKNDNREAIDVGLKYVNNDACFPSITVVGQIMQAVLSGKYDTNRLAIIMSQTGGCCRASNYVAFIRRALKKAGLSHIPVISLNASGMEKNPGIKWPKGLLLSATRAIVYGDLLMRCLYRVRPYETEKNAANKLCDELKKICIDSLIGERKGLKYQDVCKIIVEEFDKFQIDDTIIKPRVGVVGEILVKYMPLANNHLVDLLEKEGVEVFVPDLIDFFNYSLYGDQYKYKNLGGKKIADLKSKALIKIIKEIRKPAVDALKNSKRFEAPVDIEKLAKITEPYISVGNQYGEGWFLTAEMIELIEGDVPNIVCIQPFACLPNHVVGKGVIKVLKSDFPQANIVAVDYDPGASEVNQLNRIKLMLSTAKERVFNTSKNY